MQKLSFDVRTDIVLQGKRVDLKTIEQQQHLTGIPSHCFLAAWIGGDNTDCCIAKLDPATSSARVNLNLRNKDVNTVKFALYMNVNNMTGTRAYHLASFYTPVADLVTELDSNTNTPLPECKPGLAFASNFEKNASILYFKNAGTETKKIKGLSLRASSLFEIDTLNNHVMALTAVLQKEIQQMKVTTELGAPQFIPVNVVTSLPMMGLRMSYALLPGFLRASTQFDPHPAWQLYDLCCVLHQKKIAPSLLMKMGEKDLIMNIGNPMIQNRCNCAITAPYSEDLTSDIMGRVCRGTEIISRSYDCVSLACQRHHEPNPARPPAPTSQLRLAYPQAESRLSSNISQLLQSRLSLQSTLSAVANGQPVDYTPRSTSALIIDDCENSSAAHMGQHEMVKRLYTLCDGSLNKLQNILSQTVQEYPHLFKNLSTQDLQQISPVLLRLGHLAASKQWNCEFTVVTARQASMSGEQGATGGESLAGHGVCDTQIVDHNGTSTFLPLEATSSMIVQPNNSTLGRTSDIPTRMADGSVVQLSPATLMSAYAQNLFQKVYVSPLHCVQANCKEPGKDAREWTDGFYMGAFFSGFLPNASDIGNAPCQVLGQQLSFGAPLNSFNSPTTCAWSISPEKIGVAKPDVVKLMTNIASECWPPQASKQQFDAVLAHWAPVDKFNWNEFDRDPQKSLSTLVSFSFDNHDDHRACRELLDTLAAEFNKAQSQDPNEDGHRLRASNCCLGVCLNFYCKLPPDGETMKGTTMRNLNAVTQRLGIDQLTNCPVKAATVNAQMRQSNTQDFFLGACGEGVLHSFRYQLA